MFFSSRKCEWRAAATSCSKVQAPGRAGAIEAAKETVGTCALLRKSEEAELNTACSAEDVTDANWSLF